MRLLLDTHVLLWALGDPDRLDRNTRSLMERSEALVSAASIWEIAIKAARGKLEVEPDELVAEVEPAGYILLPVTGQHAARVFSLGTGPGDPFDRLLVAQAQVEGLVLLTHDEALLGYGSCVRLVD